MPDRLPALRLDLDFMPSPVSDRPGLLIRDSRRYSDVALIIPPVLIECLRFFDAEHTELDLREFLVRLTGDLQVSELARHLAGSLDQAGFLHNEAFEQMRDQRHREFAESAVREASHSGSGYPEEPDELRRTMLGYLDGDDAPATAEGLIGVAAPHVSPHGGWQSYRAAYRALAASDRDRIFVLLGTSHYGEPDRFGLTRKPFQTPYGETRAAIPLVDELAVAAPEAVLMEDYCHSVEHSIEFQVVFLQHLYGPEIQILPILCGSYARSIYQGGKPEDSEAVRRFLGALGDMAAREGRRLFWVLGIDMAHMGRRYGDPFHARAGAGEMLEVDERDRARIDRITSGDRAGFWDLVQENHDDLKWCGSSPVYTFLSALPDARARLLRYEQWNIDEERVVSFAGMAFTGGD